MDATMQRAIVAAAILASEGKPVSLASRSFWKIHSGFEVSERRSIIAGAAAITEASEGIDWQDPTGNLSDLYPPLGYGVDGPAESASPRVFAKASFETVDSQGRVKIVFRSIGIGFDWNDSLQDVMDAISEAIGDMEGEYGLGEGTLLGESVVIY